MSQESRLQLSRGIFLPPGKDLVRPERWNSVIKGRKCCPLLWIKEHKNPQTPVCPFRCLQRKKLGFSEGEYLDHNHWPRK